MKQPLFISDSNLFKKQTKKNWKKNQKNKYLNYKYEDYIFDPIYFPTDINQPNTVYQNPDWKISVEIDIKNEKQANKEALKALKLGANSICFLNFKNHKLNLILENIQIDIINLNFKQIYDFKNLANSLIILATQKYQHTKLNKLHGCFYMNDISRTDFMKYSEKLPNYRFFNRTINISSFNDNLSEIEKSLLTPLTNTFKTSISKLSKHITYIFEIDNNFLFEIAKIRSFNIVYEKKFQQLPYIQAVINCKKSKVNSLIESTTKSISAILGGCDELLIQSKNPIELNLQQQLILKHESFLHLISDPLHGSYYIEKLSKYMNDVKANRPIKKKLNIPKWITEEGLKLKGKYQKKDVEKIKHLNFGVGEPPFIRGPYSSMYCEKKWTIRQYAGFSTAKESNTFYKKNLQSGQTGLSIAFDLPSHRGYDSDNKRVFGDIGKAGVAIDTIDDMEILFDDIDLSKTSVSMTMNGAVIPIMAFFIATALKKGVLKNELTGTIQNDILKEFMVRNTYIYPPKPSMRIVRDIFKYTSKHMPKFNTISVSGYHMLEAGASADIELAYTLCNGLEYIRNGIQSGLKIDEFAPRLSFFWGIGMNFFTEIAKLRAARILWAEMIAPFKPKNPKSLMLRSHCQTSGWSLTKQSPVNNITRTTIEALAAIMGGTQSLHTNALDEAISLPTEESAKIARDTQLFLQQETDICNAIDPFGGSYYVEVLTEEIKEKAKKHIQEIENIGGMVQAIELGIPKLKIEQSAIKRQTKIDSSKNLIIGLNCFQEEKKRENIKILEIDNKKVQDAQIKRLRKIKKSRNEKIVKEHLNKIEEASYSEKANLLELAISAAESKATLEEISFACEKVFGRYEAKTTINSGIYEIETKNDERFILGRKLSNQFKENYGRRPRIMTAKLGQDGHDRGMKIIATSFSDIGFDVDIAPLFQTPKEIAKQGTENDVHIIGVSSLAGGHNSLIPELIKELKILKRNDIMIIAGGIIPEKDYKYLEKKGVKKIFGPGTIVIEAAISILQELLKECK